MKGGELRMIKVEALDTYEKLSVQDSELKQIPKKGEQFEVTKERLNVLLGNNGYNTAFVKLVEEDTEITEEVVQSLAEAITKQADEDSKSVEEVALEIVEEAKEEQELEVTEKETPKKDKKSKDSK